MAIDLNLGKPNKSTRCESGEDVISLCSAITVYEHCKCGDRTRQLCIDGKISLHVICKSRWMGKLNVIFLQFLYSTLLCVCPFFSILFYVYFFIWLNKITKHKSRVHCLIMKSTPLLEKDLKHSIPLFMKRNGCFMLSTFLFGQLQCYSVANHAI